MNIPKSQFWLLLYKKNLEMIPFLNLKDLNKQYREELITAITEVIDSDGISMAPAFFFEKEFANYCETKVCAVGTGNGLDSLILILRAYKELGFIREGDEIIVPQILLLHQFLLFLRIN